MHTYDVHMQACACVYMQNKIRGVAMAFRLITAFTMPMVYVAKKKRSQKEASSRFFYKMKTFQMKTWQICQILNVTIENRGNSTGEPE